MNAQVVNTVIQVTSEPPRIAVTINKKNYTHDLIMTGNCINQLCGCNNPKPKFFVPHLRIYRSLSHRSYITSDFICISVDPADNFLHILVIDPVTF